MGKSRRSMHSNLNKVHKKGKCLGAFWSMGTVKLQFFEGNMDSKKYIEILNNSKREMNKLIPDKWILQWDNDSKHFSNITLDYYIENDIKVLEWPAYSPDLNPIENIWGAIKNKLAGRSFTNVEALSKEISEHWKHLTVDNWLRLTNSMRDRINTWILNKGQATGY